MSFPPPLSPVPGSHAAAINAPIAATPQRRRPQRAEVPSTLSVDEYEEEHEVRAIVRRARNSPLLSPLRYTSRFIDASSIALSSRHLFNHLNENRMNDDNGDGAIAAEERGSSPTEPAVHRVRFIDGHTNIKPTRPGPIEEPTNHESDGPDPEDSPGGSFTPDYVVIPSHCRTIIESVCKEDWGVDKPREFQVQAIFRGAMCHGSYMSITAKTGYGKSLVHLAIASMRRGVSIVMVPLLGLGTDQVAKAIHQDKNILAWHVDEFKGNDAKLLRKSLYRASADDMAASSTILFVSPHALAPDSDMI